MEAQALRMVFCGLWTTWGYHWRQRRPKLMGRWQMGGAGNQGAMHTESVYNLV